MTCFAKESADKFFLVLQGRENEWTGGTGQTYVKTLSDKITESVKF